MGLKTAGYRHVDVDRARQVCLSRRRVTGRGHGLSRVYKEASGIRDHMVTGVRLQDSLCWRD
jgi:hypothetical protein